MLGVLVLRPFDFVFWGVRGDDISSQQTSTSSSLTQTTSPVGNERSWDMSLAEKEYLTDMYEELRIIVTTHSFEISGFGDGDPNAWWMDDMDQYQNRSLSSTGAIITNDITMLALEYVFEDSEDISYFTNLIPR